MGRRCEEGGVDGPVLRPKGSSTCRLAEGWQAFREECGDRVCEGVKAVSGDGLEGEELEAAMEEEAVKTAKF